jgi:hypothetical protein
VTEIDAPNGRASCPFPSANHTRVTTRMTAAVLYQQGLPASYLDSKPFTIENVDLDGRGEGEVLVEVCAAGLCHSDLSVGGHEGAASCARWGWP